MCLENLRLLRRGPVEGYKVFSIDNDGILNSAFSNSINVLYHYEFGVVYEQNLFFSDVYQCGFFAFQNRKDAEDIINEGYSVWNLSMSPLCVLPIVLSGSVYSGSFIHNFHYKIDIKDGLLGERIWIPKSTIVPTTNHLE